MRNGSRRFGRLVAISLGIVSAVVWFALADPWLKVYNGQSDYLQLPTSYLIAESAVVGTLVGLVALVAFALVSRIARPDRMSGR